MRKHQQKREAKRASERWREIYLVLKPETRLEVRQKWREKKEKMKLNERRKICEERRVWGDLWGVWWREKSLRRTVKREEFEGYGEERKGVGDMRVDLE
jgi:hypothetical protein